MIAIGGWNDSAGGKYSKLVNSAASRQRFIEHVVKFILDNNFDGLDLDWEYPKCWQVRTYYYLLGKYILEESYFEKRSKDFRVFSIS